nr:hypothetical protein [Tanacetum cinerariifolium]GEY26322.1 hypothetical protein [Tanacetum cinerariifolium]
GQSVRVTLLGGLGEMLIEKRTHHVGLYPVVLIALSVKLYNKDRLYLSSTSLTMIVDDEQIHVLKQLKSDDRYRLELEVLDDTAQTVVVMFDETTRAVVKCSAGSIDEEETGLPPALTNIMGTLHTLELKSNLYYKQTNYESFTYWRVVLEEALDESGSSGTLAEIDEPKAGVLVHLTTTPSVFTPSNPGEPKKARSKERHDSDGEESFVADSKIKGSDVGCSSGTGKWRRLVLDGSE